MLTLPTVAHTRSQTMEINHQMLLILLAQTMDRTLTTIMGEKMPETMAQEMGILTITPEIPMEIRMTLFLVRPDSNLPIERN